MTATTKQQTIERNLFPSSDFGGIETTSESDFNKAIEAYEKAGYEILNKSCSKLGDTFQYTAIYRKI